MSLLERLRPRRRVVVRALCFALVLVTMGWAAERASDFFLRRNYDHKPSYVASGKTRADVLIQGPSRAVHMLDPEILGRAWGTTVYNLGLNASDAHEQLTLLELYLAHNPKPAVIFYEHASYLLASEPPGRESTQFHPFLFVAALDEPVVRRSIERHAPALYWSRYVPSGKYALYNDELVHLVARGAVQTLSGSREVNFKKGFQPMDLPWDGTFDAFRAEFPRGRRLTIDPSREAALREFLIYAEKRGIEVVVYQAPILSEALSYLRGYEELDTAMREITAELGASYVTFYDLALVKEREWFYNATHLNRAGTERFTTRFAGRMRGYVPADVRGLP